MKKFTQVVILFYLLSTSLFSVAQEMPNFPFIVVSGKASTEVAPDIAKISLTILGAGKQSKQVLKTVSQRGVELVELAQKYQLDFGDIKSFNLSKRVIRGQGRSFESSGGITGYEISQRFEINMDDIEHYSAFMDKLIAMDNVNNVQIAFDVSSRDSIITELVKQASEDAKTQAIALAVGLESRLDGVFAASTQADFSSFLAKFGIANPQTFERDVAHLRSAGQFNMFVPQTIKITKAINVVYRLKVTKNKKGITQ